jgi:septal ring factor EnvC (AmiA/AmiB activator)
VADRESKIKNLMGVNLDLQSEIKELHQMVDIRSDLERQVKDTWSHIDNLKDQKEALTSELDNAGDYILEQEERVNTSNLTAYELLQ